MDILGHLERMTTGTLQLGETQNTNTNETGEGAEPQLRWEVEVDTTRGGYCMERGGYVGRASPKKNE